MNNASLEFCRVFLSLKPFVLFSYRVPFTERRQRTKATVDSLYSDRQRATSSCPSTCLTDESEKSIEWSSTSADKPKGQKKWIDHTMELQTHYCIAFLVGQKRFFNTVMSFSTYTGQGEDVLLGGRSDGYSFVPVVPAYVRCQIFSGLNCNATTLGQELREDTI